MIRRFFSVSPSSTIVSSTIYYSSTSLLIITSLSALLFTAYSSATTFSVALTSSSTALLTSSTLSCKDVVPTVGPADEATGAVGFFLGLHFSYLTAVLGGPREAFVTWGVGPGGGTAPEYLGSF